MRCLSEWRLARVKWPRAEKGLAASPARVSQVAWPAVYRRGMHAVIDPWELEAVRPDDGAGRTEQGAGRCPPEWL
jgi:hypothetical protein